MRRLPLKTWRSDRPEIQRKVRKALASADGHQDMLELQTLGGTGREETHSALEWMIERGGVEMIPDPAYGPAYPRFGLTES